MHVSNDTSFPWVSQHPKSILNTEAQRITSKLLSILMATLKGLKCKRLHRWMLRLVPAPSSVPVLPILPSTVGRNGQGYRHPLSLRSSLTLGNSAASGPTRLLQDWTQCCEDCVLVCISVAATRHQDEKQLGENTVNFISPFAVRHPETSGKAGVPITDLFNLTHSALFLISPKTSAHGCHYPQSWALFPNHSTSQAQTDLPCTGPSQQHSWSLF